LPENCRCADGMPHTKIKFTLFFQNYTCSRLLSIALGICSLSTIFYKKKYTSLLLAFAGTTIHPLTSGWVLPLWLFYYYPKCRKIILLPAILLPLSYLIHKGYLDSYPSNWLSRPLDLRFKTDEILNIVTWTIFFAYFVQKFSKTDSVKNFSSSLILTYIIASYWNVAATVTEHIFLYQVQTWRAEWLPSITAFPIFATLLIPRIKKYLKQRFFTTHDLSLFLIGASIWIP